MKKQKSINKLLLCTAIIGIGITVCGIYMCTQVRRPRLIEKSKTRNVSNDIWLYDSDGGEDALMLYGLKPGMYFQEVLEYLDRDGIVLERHNMQWYATGIELEKAGIKRLEWDADEQVSYFRAIIDTEKADMVKDYSLWIDEREFSYYDEDRNVNVIIGYPEVHLETNRLAEETINGNIERVVQSILQEDDVTKLKDVEIYAGYTIKNAESEFFSIVWEGTYSDGENDKEIMETLTCNILEGGRVLNVTEIGLSAEEIKSEIAWRMEMKEDDLENQPCEDFQKFYVTPLHLILVCPGKDGQEADIISMWR